MSSANYLTDTLDGQLVDARQTMHALWLDCKLRPTPRKLLEYAQARVVLRRLLERKHHLRGPETELEQQALDAVMPGNTDMHLAFCAGYCKLMRKAKRRRAYLDTHSAYLAGHMRKVREARKLSLAYMSDWTGVPQEVLFRLESGECSKASLRNTDRLFSFACECYNLGS
jgi:hypothetical protein